MLNGCNAECVGDQYFVLYDQAGSEVAVNDDGTSAGCGLCAEIKYSATQACQVYSLHEGCYSDDSCEGEVEVTGGTVTFSLAPTPAPYIFDCAAYSATNTNSDLSNYVTCNVYACPESTLTLSGCNSACVGDQYLRLYSASGAEVGRSQRYCLHATVLRVCLSSHMDLSTLSYPPQPPALRFVFSFLCLLNH